MAEISEITKEKIEKGSDKVDRGDSKVEKPDTPAGTTFVNASKIQQDAEKLRAKRELPKPPGTVIKFDELKHWLGILTDDMLERLMIYVYRHRPVINRQFVDPNADNNIDVISGQGCKEISEDYFIDRHGGGSYGLTIKDTDTIDKKKNNRGYFEARLYINETQYPPKLDYREVDWMNEKNKGYFAWARSNRIVDNNGVVMDPTKKDNASSGSGSGNGGVGGETVGIMKVVFDAVSRLTEAQQRDIKKQIGGEDAVSKPMTDLLIAKMQQDSPNQIMPLVTALLPVLLKQPAPSGDGGLTAMATMMGTMMTAMMKSSVDTMAMMQENNKTTVTLFTAMMAANKNDDGGDRLREVVEIAKMIKGPAAPEQSTTERIVDKGIELLMPIANIIQNVTGMKASQMGMGLNPTPAGHPNANMPRALINNPQGTPTGGDNFNRNTVTSENRSDPSKTLPSNFGGFNTPQTGVDGTPALGVSGTPDPNDAGVIQAVQQYGAMILQALNASKEGWEFAEDVSRLFGDMVIQSVARHGTDSLIRGMKQVPEFWTVIDASYGEAHMRKWCDEFINYKAIVKQMELDGNEDDAEEEIEGNKEEIASSVK